MMYNHDKRTVLTLDAGGTNFVFSAIQANNEVVNPITLPAYGSDLDKCLNSIVEGFEQVKKELKVNPIAISFAFPGPADYINGIIGDLPNLPAFKGGVALGPFLESKFKIVVTMVDEKQVMISVIIPVYNSEKYLHKCIDSVLAQSYTNFELILVNDGSTDGSGVICDGYAEKDERVKVFH